MPQSKNEDIARRFLVDDLTGAGVPILERKWYYSIEIEPGRFTDGRNFSNIHLTRSALRNLSVKGLDCIDIGAMESLISILLFRRGAGRLVAYDRLDLSERIGFLQEKLGVNFEYLCGFPLSELPGRLEGRAIFDVVMLSGVLYHMFDPLAGLLYARRLIREGGIMIVETAAAISPEHEAYFNTRGELMGGDNFWALSVTCLDYLLRFARLKPLDCFYKGLKATKEFKWPLCRVCVPCLAVPGPPADEDDDWISRPQKPSFSEFLGSVDLSSQGRPEIPYSSPREGLVRRKDGSVKIYESIAALPESQISDQQEQVCLKINALY